MKTIRIGNRSLEIKDYYCSQSQNYIEKDDGKLWLYVNITDVCPASCPFCVNPGRSSGTSRFEPFAFRDTLQEICGHIYGVSFTGGEPMLEPDLLDEAIGIANEIMGDTVEIDMVTSGIFLEKILGFRNLKYLDSIHISRHRADDEENRKLMGLHVPSGREIRNILERMDDSQRVVFNCVLDCDGVYGPDQIAEYLEMAAETGVSNTSFISMIPANGYCRSHYVDPEQFQLEQDKRFRVWNHFHDYDYCSCSTGDYLGNHRKVRFYYRMPGKRKASYVRQLVYTADNKLLDGFCGERILLEDQT